MSDSSETIQEVEARHRGEVKELQERISHKRSNASKKNRKIINEECANLERDLQERHEYELYVLNEEQDAVSDAVDGQDVEIKPSSPGQLPPPTEALAKLAVTKPSVRFDASAIDKDHASDEAAASAAAAMSQGKKRNRQKERLARRAAEQEAAISAAESEAANMTDHRKVEKTYMLSEFKAHSLTEKEIQPDGHCLFSAVADQLGQHKISLSSGQPAGVPNGEKMLPYRIVRKAAADYIERHGDEFAGFLEEPVDRYAAKIRDTAEWGGQLELLALANIYHLEIHVVQDRQTEIIKPNEEPSADGLTKIWLAYYRHGYGLGEHYNSLRRQSP